VWKEQEYQGSELFQREARGLLAEKCQISTEKVRQIENVLRVPSRRGSRKSTPTEVVLQMVALEHVARDVKTIEKVLLDYLAAYPEKKRSRQSPA